jgi:hypothetical protein
MHINSMPNEPTIRKTQQDSVARFSKLGTASQKPHLKKTNTNGWKTNMPLNDLWLCERNYIESSQDTNKVVSF